MFRKGLELVKPAFLVTFFEFCKDGFIIRLPSRHDVIEDPSQFVGCVLDGLDSAVTGALGTIKSPR